MAVDLHQTSKPPPSVGSPAVDEPPRKPRLWRRVCIAVLLILGAILTPVAVFVTYAKTQILDTDRYVATVKPLPIQRKLVTVSVTALLRATHSSPSSAASTIHFETLVPKITPPECNFRLLTLGAGTSMAWARTAALCCPHDSGRDAIGGNRT